MRKSAREKLLEESRLLEANSQQTLDFDALLELLLGGKLNPTQRAFIYSPDRIKAYKGPAGCAKTSTICAALLARALLQPGFKGLVARYDYNDLMDTTALRLEEMLQRLPPGVLLDRDKSPPMKWWIRCAVPGSEATPSQITFMGLKEHLGSYEFNAAIIDEADEVEETRVHEVNTRLRNKGGNYAVMLAFNPPDKHHWLYTACTGKDFQDKPRGTPTMTLFEPNSRENSANLPADYYEQMARTLPEDMRQRLVNGEWGSSFSGEPVYREFIPRLHVMDDLKFIPGTSSPVLRFWDFGYNRPCCIWAQVDPEDGGLNVLEEYLGDKQEVLSFAREVKARTLKYGGGFVVDYGDPAVAQKKDTGQTLSLLRTEGITMLYRVSRIEEGTRRIRLLLEQLTRGKPLLRFSRTGVPILIAGLRGGYRLDSSGQKAVKDGYYDHECFQGVTLIDTPRGRQRLDCVTVNDQVYCVAPDGQKVAGTVVERRLTSKSARVLKLSTGGTELVGTPNHPVLTQRGWVPMAKLRYYDIVMRYGPSARFKDGTVVRRREVLPVGEILLASVEQEADEEGVPALRGVGDVDGAHSEANACASQGRRQVEQRAVQPVPDDTGGAHAPPQSRQEDACADVGSGTRTIGAPESMDKEARVRASLSHLRHAVRHALSEEGEILRAEVQNEELQGDARWTLEEVHEAMEVFNLKVEPYSNFIADGVVVHNCDAFRYGITNIFDDTGATTLNTGTELNPTLRRTPNTNNVPDSVEYDPAHDVYDYVPELLEN